jgi:hypothetical protein
MANHLWPNLFDLILIDQAMCLRLNTTYLIILIITTIMRIIQWQSYSRVNTKYSRVTELDFVIPPNAYTAYAVRHYNDHHFSFSICNKYIYVFLYFPPAYSNCFFFFYFFLSTSLDKHSQFTNTRLAYACTVYYKLVYISQRIIEQSEVATDWSIDRRRHKANKRKALSNRFLQTITSKCCCVRYIEDTSHAIRSLRTDSRTQLRGQIYTGIKVLLSRNPLFFLPISYKREVTTRNTRTENQSDPPEGQRYDEVQ